MRCSGSSPESSASAYAREFFLYIRRLCLEVVIVTINTMTGTVAFADPFETKQGASLGYAFTWLKNGFGKPLGEWP